MKLDLSLAELPVFTVLENSKARVCNYCGTIYDDPSPYMKQGWNRVGDGCNKCDPDPPDFGYWEVGDY